MNTNLLKQYSEEKLALSLKYNAFDMYVLGVTPYGVKIKNVEGQEEECIFAKMEAIYKCYNEDKELEIDKKLYEVLLEYAPKVKGISGVITILRTIEYQIVKEKEGMSPFEMDNQKLLQELKNNLAVNKELYQSEKYQSKDFWNTIEEHNNTLYENYGYKIL